MCSAFVLSIASAASANPTVNPNNGHRYALILHPGITWTQANDAANALPGGWHLATITSASENAFIEALLQPGAPFFEASCLVSNLVGRVCGGIWLGGLSSSNAAQDWRWVTGEPFTFGDWGPFEPFGNGDRLRIDEFRDRSALIAWNDVPAGFVRSTGYIIENDNPIGPDEPFGFVDTPLNNTMGVTGSVPITGWALDNAEVLRVMVCRAAFGAEVAPADPNCGGAAQIFVGFGLFIDGARPDVEAAFPTYPMNSRAGWGFMLLTNMLPSQGNGTYVFYMFAQDQDGRTTLLGTRTVTCANASATKPFGAIDTPAQGGTASGGSYVNFGWALTPLSKTIPIDGSTIAVQVDGVTLGTPTYNNFRSDIAALFPGLNNTNGAVGFRMIDTTALSSGLHTIQWVVTDDQGATDGIGSRYFTVSNGAAAPVAATRSVTAAARLAGGGEAERIAAAPLDRSPLGARRGWHLEAPSRTFTSDAFGRTVIRSEEVNRVELQLGAGWDAGYLRTGDGLAPLPVGSHLDPATGAFTWAPGVGFVGAYDLVFIRHNGPRPVARREVRILLQPKGSGGTGLQVVIDVPTSQQDVGQPFAVSGWAADLNAASGTGIETLHAWAYPLAGGPPVFLGATVSGGGRPDVAAVHGEQFEQSGFGFEVQGLAHGHYDLAVFAWSTEAAAFAPATVVRITVR